MYRIVREHLRQNFSDTLSLEQQSMNTSTVVRTLNTAALFSTPTFRDFVLCSIIFCSRQVVSILPHSCFSMRPKKRTVQRYLTQQWRHLVSPNCATKTSVRRARTFIADRRLVTSVTAQYVSSRVTTRMYRSTQTTLRAP